MNKDELQVGQQIYILNIGNMARSRKQELKPAEITKTGRKYFSARIDGGYQDTEFHIDGLLQKTHYSANYKAYLKASDWEEEKERNEIVTSLRKLFQYGQAESVSIEDLRAINEIVKKS
jgi:hypothetical protein